MTDITGGSVPQVERISDRLTEGARRAIAGARRGLRLTIHDWDVSRELLDENLITPTRDRSAGRTIYLVTIRGARVGGEIPQEGDSGTTQ